MYFQKTLNLEILALYDDRTCIWKPLVFHQFDKCIYHCSWLDSCQIWLPCWYHFSNFSSITGLTIPICWILWRCIPLKTKIKSLHITSSSVKVCYYINQFRFVIFNQLRCIPWLPYVYWNIDGSMTWRDIDLTWWSIISWTLYESMVSNRGI